MSQMSNLEAMARAVTERVCRRNSAPDEDVSAWVDAHWYIAAADLEAGLIDEQGEPLPGYSPERARTAVADWLRRNPR
ncbi:MULTISPECIES: hypothetical protein [Lichenihabitans]|uniref:hypothetical protein n=1 Tax=Lichenihabitans TaxID=2723776 RepID=UPI0010360B45|nr:MULTISPECIES: hypothetical protein [Lichenihabitans]UDL94197.1 hypothetical protein LGH83_16945 [Lichenihabitans sp. PAMC28606]